MAYAIEPSGAAGLGDGRGRRLMDDMSVVDYVAFFIPLVFIVVLYRSRVHFLQNPVALVGLVLLAVVSILHFDVGMLTTDPYDAFLDDIGAPRRTWTATVVALILLSYSGEIQAQFFRPRRMRDRTPRRRRGPPAG